MGSVTYRAKEQELYMLAAYLGFGFMSLVDLLKGICTSEGCSSLDDDTLLDEFAVEPVGLLGAEPMGERAGDLVGKFVAELTGEPGGEFIGLQKEEQKHAIPPLVGTVWDACSALKKTPATNSAAIG